MEDFDKEMFALDRVKEGDKRYIEGLVKSEQIQPYQAGALGLAIENRRQLAVALKATRSENLPSDPVAKSLDILAKNLGMSATTQPNKAYQQMLLENERSRGRDFINFNLEKVSFLVWKLAIDMFGHYYGKSDENISPADLKKFLNRLHGAANQVMAIAENRVPLFPQQALRRMEIAPESEDD